MWLYYNHWTSHGINKVYGRNESCITCGIPNIPNPLRSVLQRLKDQSFVRPFSFILNLFHSSKISSMFVLHFSVDGITLLTQKMDVLIFLLALGEIWSKQIFPPWRWRFNSRVLIDNFQQISSVKLNMHEYENKWFVTVLHLFIICVIDLDAEVWIILWVNFMFIGSKKAIN